MPSIFLSHNQKDKPFVRRLAKDLTSEGVKVWLDEAEIKIGDSLLRKIQSGIYAMDYLGIVLSPDSVKSAWVQEELEQALHIQISEAYAKVLPILLRDCEMPGFLLDKVYADFRSEDQYQESFKKLLEGIRSKYLSLQKSALAQDDIQERISDVLVKDGYNELLELVKNGSYSNELRKFIVNQAVQPNLRIMALKAFIESGRQDDSLFKQLLEDFDIDIRKAMVIHYREHDFEIDEETLRKVIKNAPESSSLLEHTLELTSDAVKSKKMSSDILLAENIINDSYWVIPFLAISGIAEADEPDSLERLSRFNKVIYHTSRRKIREYILSLNNNGKINDENREKAIKLLLSFCNDGKSSEGAQRKMKDVIKKISKKKSWFSWFGKKAG